jgi:hypothetical protein
LDREAGLEVGERAEGGVGLVIETVNEGGGVAGADLNIRGDAAEGAFEVVGDVEGDAAGGEAVELVAGGDGDGTGELVGEEGGDELGVGGEDELAELATLVDEQGVGSGGLFACGLCDSCDRTQRKEEQETAEWPERRDGGRRDSWKQLRRVSGGCAAWLQAAQSGKQQCCCYRASVPVRCLKGMPVFSAP